MESACQLIGPREMYNYLNWSCGIRIIRRINFWDPEESNGLLPTVTHWLILDEPRKVEMTQLCDSGSEQILGKPETIETYE
jgi:hypothetical protein